MNTTQVAKNSACVVAATLLLLAAAAQAQTSTTKPAAKATPAKTAKPAKPAGKAIAAKPAEPVTAGAEQVEAAGLVYYGAYACEFNQTIHLVASPKYPSYVDLKHGKADYLMKPVLSSTGAIRLEDVRGDTLMVQISNKSMLLNVKTAQRLVDDCVSEKQREAIEAARIARAGQTTAPTPMLSHSPAK